MKDNGDGIQESLPFRNHNDWITSSCSSTEWLITVAVGFVCLDFCSHIIQDFCSTVFGTLFDREDGDEIDGHDVSVYIYAVGKLRW